MSIYRRRKLAADQDVTAPISLTALENVRAPLRLVTPRDGVHLRRQNPVNILLPVARKWLADLPLNVRPTHLVERYPRIVNLIASEWDNQPMIRETLLQLLADHRGGRKGFPTAIFRELRAIHGHYYSRVLLDG